MDEVTLNRTLAENLNRLLKARGWSARELAGKAGVSANTVGNYIKLAQNKDHQYESIRGKEPSATLTNLQAIAKALGVPPVVLLLNDQTRATLAAKALRMSADIVDVEPREPLKVAADPVVVAVSDDPMATLTLPNGKQHQDGSQHAAAPRKKQLSKRTP